MLSLLEWTTVSIVTKVKTSMAPCLQDIASYGNN